MDKIDVFVVEKRLRPFFHRLAETGAGRPLCYRSIVRHHGLGDAVAQQPGALHAGRGLQRIPQRRLERDQIFNAPMTARSRQRWKSFDLSQAVYLIGSPEAMTAPSSSMEPSSMVSSPRRNSTLERMAACPSSRYGYWSMEYQPS